MKLSQFLAQALERRSTMPLFHRRDINARFAGTETKFRQRSNLRVYPLNVNGEQEKARRRRQMEARRGQGC
jgi:hypothetical protein